MKLKKLSAIILAAAMLLLLLCSCGISENGDSGRITREAETLDETKDIDETEKAEENEKLSEDVTDETAAENAEILYEKAEELFEETRENKISYSHFIFIGVLGKNVPKKPELPDKADGEYVENALNYLTEGEIGGVYAIVIEKTGEITGAIWSPSFNSTVVAIYPYQIADGNDMTISDQFLGMYEMEDGFYSDVETQAANANAKLVFQNAATYLTKVQIAGASLDSLLYSGKIGEKTDVFPEVSVGAALTGDDLNNALCYYMGGEDGGVYVILLDEQYNPLGVLWAKDAETSIVGAFPVSRTAEENESGNIGTADIYEAAGLN
jgi:hypothetical protein